MTKKNKQNRTPPAKDKQFDDKIAYLKAKKAAVLADKLEKKGFEEEIPTVSSPIPMEATDFHTAAHSTPTQVSLGSVGTTSYAEAVLGIGSASSNAEASQELSLAVVNTPDLDALIIETSDENHVVSQDESISLGSQDTHSVELLDKEAASSKEQMKKDEKETKQWSSLFRDNRALSNGLKLEYFPPTGEKLDFSHLQVPTLIEVWGFCLVGHFSGRFPGLKAIHDMATKWGVQVDIKSHSKGWVIFKFKSEEDRLKVLTGGPYVLFGKTMFLKELSEDFSVDSVEFLKVPIWIKLPKLAMRLWKAKELGMIASQVGVPIIADKITQDIVYTHFARVLVEVDVTKPPVTQFPIVPPSGNEYMQQVIFETYPDYCYNCKMYGHHPFNCLKLNPPKEKDKLDADVIRKNKVDADTTVKGKYPTDRGQNKRPLVQGNTSKPGLFQLPDTFSLPAESELVQEHGFDWEGRRILSVYELEADDIVNLFETNEDGVHAAYVKKKHQIMSYIPIARLGTNLQRVDNLDVPAISFTDPCLVTLPGVKRTFKWYAFNKEFFYLNVASFFDIQAKQNVDFLRALNHSSLDAPSTSKLALEEPAAVPHEEAVQTGRKEPQIGEFSYTIRNMHDMAEGDVVTKVGTDKKRQNDGLCLLARPAASWCDYG
ncbi:unnamed protein product [Cuscuta epithymum]|uniref:DUF4283 domain-containing protein n=1 Tax=Cuscuta epithymum TaxID=186058 RepID=A0AAV0CCM2_9ASTE|nr:unnamed protein product [Cuscuta epithymum]